MTTGQIQRRSHRGVERPVPLVPAVLDMLLDFGRIDGLHVAEFPGKAEQIKHFGLEFSVVDTNRTTTNLNPIDYQIVGIGSHFGGRCFKLVDVLRFWRCKWVVHRKMASFFGIVFHERAK